MTTSFLILFIMPDYSYGIFKQYNLLLLLLFLTPIMRRSSSLNNFLCVFLFLFFFVQLFLVSHLVVPFPVVVFITSALFSDLFLSRKLQQFIQELVFTLQVSNTQPVHPYSIYGHFWCIVRLVLILKKLVI